MVFHRKTNFFLVKRWFWLGVLKENHLLRGKSWFSYAKPSFYEAKPKKPSFSTSPPHSLKKMGFFGFLVLPRTSLGPEPCSSTRSCPVDGFGSKQDVSAYLEAR